MYSDSFESKTLPVILSPGFSLQGYSDIFRSQRKRYKLLLLTMGLIWKIYV